MAEKTETIEPPKEIEETPQDILPVFIPDWDQEEIDAVAEALEGGLLTEGENVIEFQKEFAKSVGAKFCVLYPSHAIAMYCALYIVKNKFSTNIIRVPNLGGEQIFNAAIMANYNPILCEVNELGSLELRDNEAGVTYHKNGRLGKASLIEDCRDRLNYHTPDKISVYDFSFGQHLTAGGQGGAVCCDEQTTYEALLRMKTMGKNPMDQNELFGDDHMMWGMDFAVTELQGAFALAQLKKLPAKMDRLNVMDNLMRQQLADEKNIKLLQGRPYKYIDVLVPDAADVQIALLKKGFMTERFPKPLHLQQYSFNAGRLDNKFTTSEELYKTGLLLPSMTQLEDDDLLKIVTELKQVVRGE